LTAIHALEARDLNVPSDISSAAFFIVAAACLPGSEIVLRNVGLNPTRTAILDVLQRCGANIEILDEREISMKKSATFACRRRKFRAETKAQMLSAAKSSPI
jgi:5-enolpyruvylshikimate-3-phosphate synthase